MDFFLIFGVEYLIPIHNHNIAVIGVIDVVH